MAIIPKIAHAILEQRKSQDSITIIDSPNLSYYPITDWDLRVIIILWVLFLITSIFLALRLYSRVYILQFYVLEDYLYNIAFTLLLAYNALITFYSFHGLGSQLLNVMTTADVKLAVVIENVLFDLASLGLVLAKTSLVAFLMRLAPQHHSPFRWRFLIIGPLAGLAIVSFGSAMAYWSRCFSELAGNTLLCGGIQAAMLWMQIAAALSVAVDLYYAALPWYLLRRLTRPRREKIMIQASMSLGVIAAACGIGRALAVYDAMNNISANSAAILYLWHGAEMAVTMICIGMPVCRPAISSMLQAIGLRPHRDLSSRRSGNGNGNRNRSRRHYYHRSGGSNNNNHNNNHHHEDEDDDAAVNNKSAAPSYIRNFNPNATWEDAVGAADVDSWSQRRILGVGDATSAATSGSDKDEHGGEDVSIPMRSLSKGGITVTRTINITNGRKDSL